jgi:hypothetical protein
MTFVALACFGLGLGVSALDAAPLNTSLPMAGEVSAQAIPIANENDNDRVRVKRNFNQRDLGYIPGNVWSPYGRVDCIGWWKKLPGGRLRCMGQMVPAD